jgi:hypothetical protein
LLFDASGLTQCGAAQLDNRHTHKGNKNLTGFSRRRPLLAYAHCADRGRGGTGGVDGDEATYANPHRYPSGDRTTVIVNGTIVIENAVHTGATPGLVLRRGADGQVG